MFSIKYTCLNVHLQGESPSATLQSSTISTFFSSNPGSRRKMAHHHVRGRQHLACPLKHWEVFGWFCVLAYSINSLHTNYAYVGLPNKPLIFQLMKLSVNWLISLIVLNNEVLLWIRWDFKSAQNIDRKLSLLIGWMVRQMLKFEKYWITGYLSLLFKIHLCN